jgi:hypothetical protein
VKQTWHTEGYNKLARIFWYLSTEALNGRVVNDEVEVITKAGKAIRKQTERNANRRARHDAMTSCGLVRVRVNGKVFYE